MSNCIRCHIIGKVQGVWFRASVREQAQRLELTGYAANIDDGSVEVLACGNSDGLTILQQWLQDGGAPQAEIERFECHKTEGLEVPVAFTIL